MRSRSLPLRSPPSFASLPDEANEKFGSRSSTTHCDADVEIVPDTFDEGDAQQKKRVCLGTNESSRDRSEPLNLDACIVCGILDKRVSRCAGIGCVISFHGECLDAECGGSEDPANAYCPYCWFKIVAAKYRSAREMVIEAEKAVCKYLDKEMTNTNSTLSGDEDGNRKHSEDCTDIASNEELQSEKDIYSSKEEQVKVEKDSGRASGEKTPKNVEADHPEEDNGKLEVGTDISGNMKEDKVTDEVEALEHEERRVATESFQDAMDDETANDQTKANTGAGGMGKASPFWSMQGSFSGNEKDEVQQKEKRRRRRRQIVIDSEISSNESTNEREDVTEQLTSSAQVSSPAGKRNNQQRRKLNAATNADKSKTVREISVFKKDQRKRLFWTPEEEEMLKVGVERFAAEANKNMPWRKILEMGDKVFDETRTPADLKDKWRNMIKANKTT